LEINTEKTKIMAFRGKEPARSKTGINNRTFKQVNIFSYFGCNTSYKEEKEMNMKITNFVKIVRIINQIFKPALVFRHTRI
jgi:hypothetical protein